MKLAIKYILYFINFLLYITSCVSWIAIPEYLTFNISLSITAIGITLLLMLQYREKLLVYANSSQFKNLISTLVTVGLLFFVFCLINYLGFKHNKQWDLTKDKSNSLSSQSKEIISHVTAPLIFKVFIRRVDKDNVFPLLDLYRLYKKDIVIDLIDPDIKPSIVKEYNIKQYGTIVVEYNQNRAQALEVSEAAITKAILKVIKNNNPLIYFINGHQEGNLEMERPEGFSYLKSLMIENQYDLIQLNLTTVPAIPSNASAVVIWGPRLKFLKDEIIKIEEYLNNGGHLLIAIDPSLGKNDIVDFTNIFLEKGINFTNNLVIDNASYVDGSKYTVPLVTKYNKEHAITKGFDAQTFFPLAAAITTNNTNNKETNFNIQKLIITSNFPHSWGESSNSEVLKMKFEFNEGKDIPGPITLALAVESFKEAKDSKSSNMKIVAFANSSFVSNVYASYRANFNLYLNALAFVCDEEFSIAQDRPLTKEEPTFLSSQELGIIFYFSLIVAPLCLIATAIYLYRRRSKL
ncbi:MAG: GldG family protein [Oligoflexia bacterium]|nr:GldG family protein [Oligoflexia bacterium]